VSISSEAYKQLPFLKSFETDVELERVDSARGYAVGKIVVYPHMMEKEKAAEARKLVTLPVVVRDREMAPLDVYSRDGEMRPMDEQEIEEMMLEPGVFHRVAPRDQFLGTNLYGQMTPPNTDHQYNAGTLHKHGSVGFWKLAASTFRASDVEDFKSTLRSDPPLRHAFLHSPVLRPYVEDLLAHQEKTASDVASSRAVATKPTVVQFLSQGKDYLVKSANHTCYAPQTQKVSRFGVQKQLSKTAFSRLLEDGYLTLTVEPVEGNRVSVKTAQEADRFGTYTVRKDGKEIEGLVVPRMVNLEGNPLSLQLFAGEGCHALQEKVAGVFLEDVQFAGSNPRGRGVLVYQHGAKAIATEPIEILHQNKVAHDTGTYVTFEARRLATGQPVRITPVPGLQKIASLGDHEVAVPTSFRWLPIEGRQVSLADLETAQAIEGSEKVASTHSVQVVSDGSFFALRGDNAHVFKDEVLTQPEAEFALGALGISGTEARELLKVAAAHSDCTIPNTRKVVDELERGAEVLTKVASAMGQAQGLKTDLLKEVALLVAPKGLGLWKEAGVVLRKETVDAILSLNFVTPENASLYVNYLPELEKVSSKLAELLVASRLGLDDVREAAAKNAMTQVNSVIRGLETLRERIQ
jgi:hypothetical protein